MKTDIYYFSATGNSLSIAKKISEDLSADSLQSIPEIVDTALLDEGDTIGIVCPIYMYNLPYIVKDFIRKIKKAEYIFIVFAGAGELGNGDKETEKFFAQENLKLSAMFNVAMPSNYTPYGCPSEEKQNDLFAAAELKVDEIVQCVKKGKEHRDGSNTSFWKANIQPGIFYKLGYKRINILDSSYWSDENCNGCGICKQVCPVGNITIEDKKPEWHNNCQFCYGCLQWCPKESIQYGKKTAGIDRYHHPDVMVKDIIGGK